MGVGLSDFGRLYVAEQLLGKAHALFRGLADALFLQIGQARFYGMGAMSQAAVVGDLDVQARGGR